ncbi:Transcriptional regulatory protein FixJ [Usitatibacter rugosus]|uniref:Transcriptional regulatory protein FixJ n=1 Tax=Usitatibacter rugosus TaxID=2732067 RepID=A0A6M4GT17_9PROT|nr:response regulator [Usitatibacter rugosus]QJR10459.1 Transcriptional regulatory protein FixJ [Usitatibacter rugosus]
MLKPRRLQVAVVDDEAHVRKALDRLMRGAGFEVQTWKSGSDFLGALPGHHLDCVILDLHMPGLSGFDVLASLNTPETHLPAIMITGHDTPGAEERARAAGASAYLRKPVDATELIEAIKRAVEPAP